MSDYPWLRIKHHKDLRLRIFVWIAGVKAVTLAARINDDPPGMLPLLPAPDYDDLRDFVARGR